MRQIRNKKFLNRNNKCNFAPLKDVNNKIKYNNLKGKQMKKNLLRFGLSLIALFVMVVANAQTYQNKEASVSWPFNNDNYATQYTKSPEMVSVWFP